MHPIIRSSENIDDFGLTVIRSSANIEGQEEKESGNVQMKLKRHSGMELHLIKASEITVGASRSLCDCIC